jgi:hypothetical protein
MGTWIEVCNEALYHCFSYCILNAKIRIIILFMFSVWPAYLRRIEQKHVPNCLTSSSWFLSMLVPTFLFLFSFKQDSLGRGQSAKRSQTGVKWRNSHVSLAMIKTIVALHVFHNIGWAECFYKYIVWQLIGCAVDFLCKSVTTITETILTICHWRWQYLNRVKSRGLTRSWIVPC